MSLTNIKPGPHPLSTHIYYYHYTLCIRCLPVIIFNMIGTYWSYFIVADLTTIFASIIVYFCVHSAFI